MWARQQHTSLMLTLTRITLNFLFYFQRLSISLVYSTYLAPGRLKFSVLKEKVAILTHGI